MQLFPHQQKALDDTADFNRVAYYLDMGLGKTYVGSEKMNQLGAPVGLVVCQKSKVDDWVEHFEQHYPGQLAVFDLTSAKALDRFFEMVEQQQFLGAGLVGVINYDLIWRRDVFLSLDGFTLILDESSEIQSLTAKRTKFILKMAPENVVMLSGRPIGGKYERLWSQVHLMGWRVTEKVFNRQYINWVTIEVGGFPRNVVDKENPYKNVDRLKSRMREHGAVFMKTEDVFDLPEQTFIEVKVRTTKEYRKFRKKRLVTCDGAELVGDTSLTYRLYSRMLCGHFNREKLDAFRDLCISTNDRLIVFYNFDAELKALKEIAGALEKPISEVNGHIKDLTAYTTEEDSITLVQYKAGAMGLNLQKANKIIYFTPTEESELFEQSKKRIHRIGQDRPCFYYLLTCENSIEDTEIFPTLGLREEYTDELFNERTD